MHVDSTSSLISFTHQPKTFITWTIIVSILYRLNFSLYLLKEWASPNSMADISLSGRPRRMLKMNKLRWTARIDLSKKYLQTAHTRMPVMDSHLYFSPFRPNLGKGARLVLFIGEIYFQYLVFCLT